MAAMPGRRNDFERVICWQFEKDFLMGETRWVHMDAWSDEMAELGYQEHLESVSRGYQQQQRWPFQATYRGNPKGPIEFQFTYENTYFMINMNTAERCRIRRIDYVVNAPPNQMTVRS
jgi:hypothetical protein